MVRKKYYPPGSPELVNPMIRFPTKACTRCGVVKDNTRTNFGSKNWGTKIRHPITGQVVEVPQTTTDVCKACMSQSHVNRHVLLRQRQVEANVAMEREAIERGKIAAGLIKPAEAHNPNAKREGESEHDFKIRTIRKVLGLPDDGSKDHLIP